MKSIDKIFDYFYKETGIIFSEKKHIIAERITRFASYDGFSIDEYWEKIQKDRELFQKLVNKLSVNETYFFREDRVYEVFVEKAKKKKEKFRILSLPTSTGEEPYSIAITLFENNLNHHFELYGCDIDTDVLEEAKKGIYRLKSLRSISYHVKEKYFLEKEGAYHIDETIKNSVNFFQGNIFDKELLKMDKFDFIFCRNLFIYFDNESREKAEKQLYQLLKPKGVLFTGHADYPLNKVGMEKKFKNGLFYFKKN
jgi:chemotaxis protein methyltransferase CheR